MNSDQVDFVFNCFHPETSRKDEKKNTFKIIFLYEDPRAETQSKYGNHGREF